MAIVKCEECGRSFNLTEDQFGKVKCKCGAILASPTIKDVAKTPASDTGDNQLSDLEAVKALKGAYDLMRNELATVIVGQDKVIEEILIAIFAKGHCLLEGVPGLAKTLMISSLAKCLDLAFKRVQFTPDLMPSDITGTEVIQDDRTTGERVFRFIKGPIFCNVCLADEINRTPPKTQAALLEAMQEKSVTVAGQQHKLSLPFFVLATQNPLEQEGTYPLPEAQLDRFLFKIFVNYPSDDEELEIMKRVTTPSKVTIAGPHRRTDRRIAGNRSARPRCRSRLQLRQEDRAFVAPQHGRSAGLHRELGELGRRSARELELDSGRQSARDSQRPVPRGLRRH